MYHCNEYYFIGLIWKILKLQWFQTLSRNRPQNALIEILTSGFKTTKSKKRITLIIYNFTFTNRKKEYEFLNKILFLFSIIFLASPLILQNTFSRLKQLLHSMKNAIQERIVSSFSRSTIRQEHNLVYTVNVNFLFAKPDLF